jgi:hypothetical protein
MFYLNQTWLDWGEDNDYSTLKIWHERHGPFVSKEELFAVREQLDSLPYSEGIVELDESNIEQG